MNDNSIIDVRTVANTLGISTKTAYMLVRRDDFPSFQVGRRWLVSRNEFLSWIEREAAMTNNRGSAAGYESK